MNTFTTPIDDRYFEDYEAGAVYQLGSVEVDETEVIEFAKRYDPQPFHIDPESAKESMFGGIIASGWHTASMMMRIIVDNYLSSVASLGSPGVDELRWLQPVRPGDTLSVRATILDTRRSRSKPDRGIVKSQVEVLNQNDEVVMRVKAANFLHCRNKE